MASVTTSRRAYMPAGRMGLRGDSHIAGVRGLKLREGVKRGTFVKVRGADEKDSTLKTEKLSLLDNESGACEDMCSFEPEDECEPEGDEACELSEYESKQDFFRAFGVGGAILLAAFVLDLDWVEQHEQLSMLIVFTLGYAGIIFEETVAFNKSGVALLMAAALWTIRAVSNPDGQAVNLALNEQLADVGQIVFFLMGAMAIVETVDSHRGFKIVTDAIKTKDTTKLLWIVGWITFFMSSILDNLTSTIVMISLLRKLISDPKQRQFFGAVVVIAANAGGAWTPIGDVTTTMLWINGQISSAATIKDIFLPSVVSLLVPLGLITLFADEVKGEQPEMGITASNSTYAPRGRLVFGAGVGALLFVPAFKGLTGLPPYLGMLCGLGALWLLTDAIHYGEKDRAALKVPYALSRIDTQGVLFFLGILLSIGCLDSAGILKELAEFLDNNIPSKELLATAIGAASALIDNVPLVAATMGMYDIAQYPKDDPLWQLIAYCAGTGGSMLIIGSAAGVAFMGMEKADFGWYAKKITPWAASGYFAGVLTYVAQHGTAAGMAPNVLAVLPAAGDFVSSLPL
eukprot:CAMPEP_0198196774 /NCGR_PEP_ID=MMETSP1445-20131203/186_1 /TAXON_ID=36898 /ORGANISM="Pyramimonas sp., Strain CCMP2087" /LENGTH=572 /DNA_ID=CAMNT_0043865741 /DNA_START=165 /DNA_END=1883 /DNA_ORIENTATION=+